MSHRIVIIGAGFGGLQAAQSLEGAGCDITLIDQRNYHLFQPLLYQVATTLLATSDIAWPIRSILRDRKDIRTLLGSVTGVDTQNRLVQIKGAEDVTYDTLIIATGARHAYFGNDHWEKDAPGLKTLEDATTIRRRLLLAFERAELSRDPAERARLMTFAVIGAGPTGVELTGIIAELAHKTLPAEFRAIDTREARVMLIEAGPRVLPAFSADLSDYTVKALERLGAEVRTGQPVTQITAQGFTLGDEEIPADTVIWAAGVKASPAAVWLGAAADRAGRVMVNENLQVAGLENVYVIGDTANVTCDGKPVPGVAPAAKQQGKYVAGRILAALRGKPQDKPFSYRHFGNLATIGRNAAVIELGRFKLKGGLAWWVWGAAHIHFLIGVRARIMVSLSWLWAFLRRQNSARLITQKETLREK